MRLSGHNYSDPGWYFITICAKDRKDCFGRIVGADVLIGPCLQLSTYGKIVQETIASIPSIHAYTIMPDHVHLVFHLPTPENGPLGTAAPTEFPVHSQDSGEKTQNIPQLIRFFKRSVSIRCGESIWQRGYYDHIVRDEADYLRVLEYVQTNPARELERKPILN